MSTYSLKKPYLWKEYLKGTRSASQKSIYTTLVEQEGQYKKPYLFSSHSASQSWYAPPMNELKWPKDGWAPPAPTSYSGQIGLPGQEPIGGAGWEEKRYVFGAFCSVCASDDDTIYILGRAIGSLGSYDVRLWKSSDKGVSLTVLVPPYVIPPPLVHSGRWLWARENRVAFIDLYTGESYVFVFFGAVSGNGGLSWTYFEYEAALSGADRGKYSSFDLGVSGALYVAVGGKPADVPLLTAYCSLTNGASWTTLSSSFSVTRVNVIEHGNVINFAFTDEVSSSSTPYTICFASYDFVTGWSKKVVYTFPAPILDLAVDTPDLVRQDNDIYILNCITTKSEKRLVVRVHHSPDAGITWETEVVRTIDNLEYADVVENRRPRIFITSFGEVVIAYHAFDTRDESGDLIDTLYMHTKKGTLWSGYMQDLGSVVESTINTAPEETSLIDGYDVGVYRKNAYFIGSYPNVTNNIWSRLTGL